MKRLNCEKIGLMLVVFVAAIVLGGGSVNADFIFGEPTLLEPPNNSEFTVYGCSFSSDGLELYFSAGPYQGNAGGKVYGTRDIWDIWLSTRKTLNDLWEEPVNLGPNINSSENDYEPAISPNGLELYFVRECNTSYILAAKRPTKDAPWGSAVPLGPPVNSYLADCPEFSADGLSLYFGSNRPGGPGGSGDYDIWVSTRATTADPWSEPVNLGLTVNSTSVDECPSISADSRVLFFDSDRTGRWELRMTTRASKDDDWGPTINLGPNINRFSGQWDPEVSPDGSTLYFETSAQPGGYGHLWQAPIIPIVDFNGDEIVDIDDLLILIDDWGTSESLCDIGPMPWGDGIVDIQDLNILVSYWHTEFPDIPKPFPEPIPEPIVAHWALDETEGDIAVDSAGENNGTVYGEPLWQPTGGKVNGAMAFDGIDDYISIPLVLSVSASRFSVFVWVKGGAPGQVIFSQKGRSNWLGADVTNGSLMTELRFLLKPDQPLQSQAVITDGEWHRIGLVWDGSNRILYVDDVEVASDTYAQGSMFGDLQIGAGKDLESGSFWSGLIDDVRIYNRAIAP
jgi:hypothetical protein